MGFFSIFMDEIGFSIKMGLISSTKIIYRMRNYHEWLLNFDF